MWITLTLFDGKPVRVNMNQALSCCADKDFTEIDFGFSVYRVKESPNQIAEELNPAPRGGWK